MGSTGFTGKGGETGPTGVMGTIGAMGPVGSMGSTGSTGSTGMTGAIGNSIFQFTNANDIFYSDGNVSIGKTLSITEDLNVTRTSYLNTISETITSVTGTSNVFPINFNNSGVFYLSNIITSTPISLLIQNIPSLTNTNKSYIISVIMKGNDTDTCYVGNVNLSTNTSLGTYMTPKFASIPSVASASSSNLIIQQISYMYIASTGFLLSNVGAYTS